MLNIGGEKMNYILFHVPHSSLKIPNKYWSICIKRRDYIKKQVLFLSDLLTDKLIPFKCHKLIFKYTRLFCDVEKFKDDTKEVMSKKGMGVIYTNDCDEKIAIPNKKYKRKVIKSYYNRHHNKLDKIVTTALKKYDNCIIIDLHSFSDEMVKKLFNQQENPDICIGTDSFYTSQNLIHFTVNHFKKYGFTVEINKPYAGTIVPNKYIHKRKKHLSSIMIEINKRIYLKNSEDFLNLKTCIDDYYKKLQSNADI